MKLVFVTDDIKKELVSKVKRHFPPSMKVVSIYDPIVVSIVGESNNLYVDETIVEDDQTKCILLFAEVKNKKTLVIDANGDVKKYMGK